MLHKNGSGAAPVSETANGAQKIVTGKCRSSKPNTNRSQVWSLAWRRDGDGWLLLAGKRRMGRVVRDSEHPSMWRIVLPSGRMSDMANLSWAKSHALVAAERELDYEREIRRPNPKEKAGIFRPHRRPFVKMDGGAR